MSLRYTTKLTGAAALLVVGAMAASAQTKPTSTKRIPITKEAGGEVVTTRVDTVTVYRTDTLRLANTDTVRLTNTVTRVDTVSIAAAPMMRPVHLPYGLYFGIGGGVSAPNGAIFNPNSAGPSAQAQLGWQSHWLGLRGDANWAKPGEDGRYAQLQADPDIVNFSADAKLNLPLFNHLFGSSHRFGLYGIGGYTHTMYKNLPIRANGFNPDGSIIVVPGNGDWTHENGWNAGGGASLSWGRNELFFETRVLAFNMTNFPQSRQMPFVLGYNIY
ncbi:MAG TPA: hypothetical protein VN706_24085 [Gemmatimonadaceae bacterium]|nr:hypothetical protein [Gemmatimonadaceae bacterium]